MSKPIYIHACGSHSALGQQADQIHHRLRQGISPDMKLSDEWLNDGKSTVVGYATGDRPTIADNFVDQNTANNRLALSALLAIKPDIDAAITRYGVDRIAVVVGTSTSGIADGEQALLAHQQEQHWPSDYHYHQQEIANTSQFIADYFDLCGPCYTISTACSSSGRVFISAKRLLLSGLVDAVIVGGADTLCKLTLNGFNSLEALSNTLCQPFASDRDGINIGEAAAFMLLCLDKPTSDLNQQPIALLGVGDSSDAHHISAPHPEGNGAEQAMRKALADAHLEPQNIGYINAHGTATPLNDAMESKAIARVFGAQVPVSSTKPLTGHTLGAASAIEAAICWHILRYQLPLPIQSSTAAYKDLGIQLASSNSLLSSHPQSSSAILSNSFAFGGNNVSLIFGYPHD
ncbi:MULTISPECIES: beta-ketoacyl-[acyl-carrier-protein] synthase family protein [Vibrio]|uniref:Beta-ketoacyl-ACP synthase n=1 Tax=Vibrio algicola TaxID=2662262 RepID=A0A5Q0TEZ2_9VIBR|nr:MULTISPECIES: beta-ketoacyl-[acyl-carrier-protein] synthase family protein [Vibrio]MBD1575176.1 beta-ketoacyl-[acyl-carrier-protein] synthase family protein [Vibrio sp. S11_S32]